MNGKVTATFTRALVTSDPQDFDFDGVNCAYFLFAWGGSVNANGGLSKHNLQRSISSQKYCFNACDVPGKNCFILYTYKIQQKK